MSTCIRKTSQFLSVVKALLSRGLFLLHGLICIWRVVMLKGENIFWTLCCTFPFMVLETVYTIWRKRNTEWKWICPSVVLYLATAVPAIWFLELEALQQRMEASNGWDDGRRGFVRGGASDREMVIVGRPLNDEMWGGDKYVMPQLDIDLGTAEWCKVLEQMLLLILIIGRWMLPKGEITREQLSQLLLVYIGMAADIIELFEAFKETKVRNNPELVMVILALWTASLVQFTLVVTTAKAKKCRPALSRSPISAAERGGCCPTEIVSIFISVLLQDAPFLVLRLLLIFRYDVLSYTNIFFTSKNSLVLVLQIYRLVVLFTERYRSSTSFHDNGGTHSAPDDLGISSAPTSRTSSSLTYQGFTGYDSALSLDQSSLSDCDHWVKLGRREYYDSGNHDNQGKHRFPLQNMQRKKGSVSSKGRKHVHQLTLDSVGTGSSSLDNSQENSSKIKALKSKHKKTESSLKTRPNSDSSRASSPNRKLAKSITGNKSKHAGQRSGPKQEVKSKCVSKRQIERRLGPWKSENESQSRTPASLRKLVPHQERRGETNRQTQNKFKDKVMTLKRQSEMDRHITGHSEDDHYSSHHKDTSSSARHHKDPAVQEYCGVNRRHSKDKESGHSAARYARDKLSISTDQENQEMVSLDILDDLEPDLEEDNTSESARHKEADMGSYEIKEEDLVEILHGNEAGRSADSSWKSRKNDWHAVKDLKSALTFINQRDGYKTVVLKRMKGGGARVVVVDEGEEDESFSL